MNKERRKKLEDLLGQLSTLKDELDELRDAEQEAFDNMPESIQDGVRGQQIADNVEALDEALDGLESVDDSLREVIGG